MRVTQYTIDVVPQDHPLRQKYDDMDMHRVVIEDRETAPEVRWGVYRGAGSRTCLNLITIQWEHEYNPSERTDEYFASHRATLGQAQAAATKAAEKWLEEIEHRDLLRDAS